MIWWWESNNISFWLTRPAKRILDTPYFHSTSCSHATCLLVVFPWPSGEHLPEKQGAQAKGISPTNFLGCTECFSREWYLPPDWWKVYADITFCCPPLTCPKGKPYQWSLNQMDEWSKGHIHHINISLTKRNWVATNHSPQGGWSIHITPDTSRYYHQSYIATPGSKQLKQQNLTRTPPWPTEKMWTSDNSEAESATARSAWKMNKNDLPRKMSRPRSGCIFVFCMGFVSCVFCCFWVILCAVYLEYYTLYHPKRH